MGIGWIGLLGKISNSLIEMGYSEKHILLLNLRNYLILIEVCGSAFSPLTWWGWPGLPSPAEMSPLPPILSTIIT